MLAVDVQPSSHGAASPTTAHIRGRWRDWVPDRWRGHIPPVATAIGVYLLIRATGLIILWIFAADQGADMWHLLTGRLDAKWYQIIAEQGYDRTLGVVAPGRSSASNLAFFPQFPGLMAAITAITPFSAAAAGLIVSWSAAVAAAWGIYRVGEHLRDHSTGVLLVAVWGALPHAIVESLGYGETLFTALTAWTLYALLRGRWITAGVICVFAGLARPTANAVIAAVVVTALVAIIRRRDGWRPWAGAALAPLGYLGYLAWVGLRLGRFDGYFHLQRETWGITFDWGADTVRQIKHVLTQPQDAPLSYLMVVAVLAVATALVVVVIADREPLPLVVFAVASYIFVFGAAGSFYGKGRYLLPVFVLLLPIAAGLANARPRNRLIVLVGLAAISGWYGTYLTIHWPASL